MQANLVTLIRIFLVFLVIGLYGLNVYAAGLAVILTIIVLYMDALDGIIARRLGIASDLGALFDITGDRIVENVFWVYFASTGRVSFWAAAIVIARSFLVDWLRTVAFAQAGETPFGEKTMMHSGWAQALVSSRFSRGLYGFTKAFIFVYLGGLIFIDHARLAFEIYLSTSYLSLLDSVGTSLVWLTVAMCLIRGIPVVWDSQDVLTRRVFPGLMREH